MISFSETIYTHLWVGNKMWNLCKHFVHALTFILLWFGIKIDTNIEGPGELPRSWKRQQWAKLRYQFLIYHHDETKLMMNKQILLIQMSQIVPKDVHWLQHGDMLGQVTWLFLLGNTCSNHSDVTVRFVIQNSNHTVNQNRQQNIHFSGESISFDKMIFWKYKLFTRVRLL